MRSLRIAAYALLLAIILIVSYVAIRPDRSSQAGLSSPSDLELNAFTQAAVPDHVAVLKDNDAARRKQAARALWQIGDYAKEATPALLAVMKDPDGDVRAMVTQALGRTSQGSQTAVPALVEALQDSDPRVRAAAAHALAEIWTAANAAAGASGRGRPGARGGKPAPAKPDPQFEVAARSAVPALTAALKDANVRVRAQAAEALVQTGALAEPAVAVLIPLLQDPDEDARLQATLALEGIGAGAATAVAPLAELLYHDKNFGIRVNAASALGQIRAHAEVAVPALVHALLNDPNPDVKTQALVGLGRFGPQAKSAVPALQKALQDAKTQANPAWRTTLTQLLEIIETKASAKEVAVPGKGVPTR